MAHWLFLPDEAFGDLAVLAKLSSAKLTKLRGLLDSREFELRYKFYVKVAEQLGVSDEAAAKLCVFVNHVWAQRARSEQTAESVLNELEYFLKRAGKDSGRSVEAEAITKYVQDNRNPLTQLFSEPTRFELSDKVRGLECGPLPHLDAIRTFCDLRPVYDKSADKIMAAFPVIILSLTIHDLSADETRNVLVQLTESDVEDFRKQFARLDKKLVKLKEQYPSQAAPDRREDR